MILIDKQEMLKITDTQNGVIIDVREKAEYLEVHFPDSVNLPLSSFNLNDYKDYKKRPIILTCHTQNRSIKAGEYLQKAGVNNIFILKNGVSGLIDEGAAINNTPVGWTIDRQFRMTLGILLLIFIIGYFFLSPYFIIIPIILCCGLIFTSLIDRCYMRMAIARLPWNKNKKV
ncbi:MAG: rhodanese-like domain-containing protein [Niabella sp.]